MRVVTLAVVTLLSACVHAEALLPTDEPLLVSSEGLLVLAADVDEAIDTTFCLEGRPDACFTPPPLSPGQPMAILRLPAGRYCLMELIVDPYGFGGRDIHYSQGRARCVSVVPGGLTYPGHLFYHRRGLDGRSRSTGLRWRPRVDIEAQILGRFPAMLNVPIRVAHMRRRH